jgi:hypothetical protein
MKFSFSSPEGGNPIPVGSPMLSGEDLAAWALKSAVQCLRIENPAQGIRDHGCNRKGNPADQDVADRKFGFPRSQICTGSEIPRCKVHLPPSSATGIGHSWRLNHLFPTIFTVYAD